MRVGTLAELWRYPIKSMQGEQLARAQLTADGIPGDRALAVTDVATGHAISGKGLEVVVQARAGSDDDGATLVLPDGRSFAARDADADEALSAWLGRPVRIERARDGARTVIEKEAGRTFRSRPGSFHDAMDLHLVTSATLEHLRALGTGDFDRRRFRPNLYVATDLAGPVERGWIGGALRIGEVTLDVVAECARCILTTSAQAELPKDRSILATISREQEEVVGVYVSAREPGEVAVGDAVELL